MTCFISDPWSTISFSTSIKSLKAISKRKPSCSIVWCAKCCYYCYNQYKSYQSTYDTTLNKTFKVEVELRNKDKLKIKYLKMLRKKL